MNQLLANLRALGRGRLLTLGGVGLGVVLAALFGLSTVMTPEYRALYTGLSATDASRMVTSLEQAGFSVRVSDDGSVVSVPEGDLPRARMAVAETGLPDQGMPGWELFDQTSGLGMNSFLQNVNRLRAMEGELARSIQTLDGVESARVHLVLPEREAFTRDLPEPSASVVIRTARGADLSRREALAIRNLVASAVPGLSGTRVTVLSATGETILAEDGADGTEAGLEGKRAQLEDRMARNIEQILTARVGAGNARVQVSVELSPERQVVVAQTYDPDQQVVRSTTTQEDQQQGQEAQGAVGVQGNLPPALAPNSGQNTNSNSRARTQESTSYEIGNTRRETVTEAGSIRRITVAVLVNGIFEIQDGGDSQYAERSPEELQRLTQLVQSAVGYDEARGDRVSVDSLRFMDYSMGLGEPERLTLGQQLLASLPAALRWLFALSIVAVVLFFGVRPALNRIRAEGEAAAALAGPSGAAPEGLPGGAPGVTGETLGAAEDMGQIAGGQRPGAIPGQRGPIGLRRLDPVEIEAEDADFVHLAPGGLRPGHLKDRLAAMAQVIDEEPEAALRMLRGWLAQRA
ncbi:flagellar basal-body MS-ring/collar protein FliF [Frigidibacter sp. MR17.24]|uniref:flagellar basal-body MS-ring/collar protein FliF n=1 Tax=Frigidibacter sp. MR17.24 TaxID=3127345 RepID=UPI0030131CF5